MDWIEEGGRAGHCCIRRLVHYNFLQARIEKGERSLLHGYEISIEHECFQDDWTDGKTGIDYFSAVFLDEELQSCRTIRPLFSFAGNARRACLSRFLPPITPPSGAMG